VKYLLIFLLVLAIFVISVTLGAQNDQQVTFNYLLAGRVSGVEPACGLICWVLPSAGWFAACSG
jgi:putative membrane protein